MAFRQDMHTQPVKDFVFSIGSAIDQKFHLEGTAFFIGQDGFAITAAHVAESIEEKNPVALFSDTTQFHAFSIEQIECHPSEDIAIIRVAGQWHSMMKVVDRKEYSSGEYMLWGYPENVAIEVRKEAQEFEEMFRPELIYNKGYIRRRISRQLQVSVYRGDKFYELSEVAGSCCSGSPVVKYKSNPWEVVGVYIGEDTGGHAKVGYAVRSDAIANWVPSILGSPLHSLASSL